MRRSALLFVCVLGLVLTGCSGPGDGSSDGPAVDLTAAEPPTITTEQTTSEGPLAGVTPTLTARPDATFRGVEMPPGTDRRGIVNTVALAQANERLLDKTDFVLTTNETTTGWTNGTIEYRYATRGTITVSTDDVASYQWFQSSLSADERHLNWAEGYVENGTEYEVGNATRYDVENVTDYQVEDATEYDVENGTYRRADQTVSAMRGAIARFTLNGKLGVGHWEPTDTTTVDGRAAVVFSFDLEGESSVSSDGRMVIDTRGLVHELTYRIDHGDGPERRVVSVTWDLDTPPTVDLGPPSWLPAAINATADDDRPAEATVTTVSE